MNSNAIYEQLGISRSWYFQIVGKHRSPSISLALRIYDLTGDQYGILEGLSPAEIAKLRKNVEGT